MKISVVVNTKNEEGCLDRCLTSAAWADEIVVVDMCSSDATVEVARRHTERVYACEDFGYVEPARNLALSHATGDWVFVLDADEVVPPRLAAGVRRVVSESEGYALVAIPRRNYIGDHLIRDSGWGLDYQPRLFRRGKVAWTDAIHSWPRVDGEIRYLDPEDGLFIKHYNYEDLTDFVERLNRYTSVEAAAFDREAGRLDWRRILRDTLDEFERRYTPREDGFYSMALAGSMAFYRFIAHCKALESVRRADGDLLFPLPGGLGEIAEEAFRHFSGKPGGPASRFVTRAELEELRAVYEEQVAREQEERASARAVYEARIEELEREREEAARALNESARVLGESERERESLRARADELSRERESQEARLGEQAASLAEARAQASQRDAELAVTRAKLDAARAQLAKGEDVLEWIQTSRSWRVATALRHALTLKDDPERLGRGLRRRLGRPPRQTPFRGFVDAPADGAHATAELEIVGWAFSTAAPVVRVEAFLDDFYLGRLGYGVERADVVAAHPEAPAACGYAERVPVFAFMAGGRTLTIRVFDAAGNAQRFTRAVSVAPPHAPAQAEPPPARHELAARTPAPGDTGAEAAPGPAAQIPAAAPAHDAVLRARLEELFAEFEARAEREPSVLDWDAALEVAEMFPHLAVFPPPPGRDPEELPYLDESVDVVMLSSAEPSRVGEARRVASALVVHVGQRDADDAAPPSAGAGEVTLRAEWKAAGGGRALPPASIIIPVFNNAGLTEGCLAQLRATLPREFDGEIVVVDDASTDETPGMLARLAGADARLRVLRNERNLGFIGSCNRGAREARGDTLVFLNNDTLPQPGWLPPLLRALAELPEAGAAGGKLVYPDGTLQEAGGVIFSDGTGLNFGKHDPRAHAPLYSFVREVDYCSGALLATPRELFLRLGGFDTRFAPAYYEDTDYCFTLRERGLRVYYQPESVIVHFEGATSGTDITGGVKKYQEVNRLKFVEKWRHALVRQPDPPAGELDLAALLALSERGRGEDDDEGS